MTIRPYQAGDDLGVQEAIKSVYDEYGFLWEPEGYHADIYGLAEHFQEPDRFWVAVNDGGTVLGTIGIELFDVIPGERGTVVEFEGDQRIAGADAELVRLYVRPEARKLGLGSKLTSTVVEYAKAQGVTLLEIWTDKVFYDAHRLYGKFGAQTVGDRQEFEPEEFEEWGMVIELEGTDEA